MRQVAIMVEDKIEAIIKLLDEINADRTVPKNIRRMVEEAKENLKNTENDMDVRINAAISILDEISNDPNIPIYTRTQVWNIVSMLEVIGKEE